jgi:hypothetical protein
MPCQHIFNPIIQLYRQTTELITILTLLAMAVKDSILSPGTHKEDMYNEISGQGAPSLSESTSTAETRLERPSIIRLDFVRAHSESFGTVTCTKAGLRLFLSIASKLNH